MSKLCSTVSWRSIPGYEGLYEISSCGVVWSLRAQKELKQHPTGKGKHLRLRLSKDGKASNKRVHQLVLLAFVGPRPFGLVTRHVDGNGFHNCVSNLTYGTHSENAIDRVAHGHDFRSKITHCPRGHEYTPENTVRYNNCRACLICRRDYHIRHREDNHASVL